jgi:hypothetical protein
MSVCRRSSWERANTFRNGQGKSRSSQQANSGISRPGLPPRSNEDKDEAARYILLFAKVEPALSSGFSTSIGRAIERTLLESDEISLEMSRKRFEFRTDSLFGKVNVLFEILSNSLSPGGKPLGPSESKRCFNSVLDGHTRWLTLVGVCNWGRRSRLSN